MENSIAPEEKGKFGRLNCIDVFRGIAVAIMLIVTNPGNPLRNYPQLRHAAWNGYTVADLAFPFFMLIMGMVIPYAVDKRIKEGKSNLSIFNHILIRSIGLFCIGILLNGFPVYDLSIIRIPGVLQRIAIAYLCTGIIELIVKATVKKSYLQIIVESSLALSIISVYSVLLIKYSFPDYKNLVQTIDLYFLKGHLYTPDWDPEGILTTFSSIATAIFGSIAGNILFNRDNKARKKFITIFIYGVVTIIVASIIQRWFPYNKNLWSSSYVLITAGIAYLTISMLFLVIDVAGFKALFKPLMILGSNPIFVYVGFQIVCKTLWLIPMVNLTTGDSMNLNVWITTRFFTPWAGDRLDSFYFSLFYTILWIKIVSSSSRKNSYIKL
ncbi:putative membrane protein [Desulfosporosinus sp. OT]|nr:putative membrane protein [Desulfosporosinus sp. OT]